MHFSFSLLRIKGLYMFRALLAHPQEVLNKRHLVYCVRIMLVGCGMVAVSLQTTATQYTKCSLFSTSWGWASNARNMQRSLKWNVHHVGFIILINYVLRDWMGSKSASYSDGTGCQCRRAVWLSYLNFFLAMLTNYGIHFKLRHNRFLPNPCQY
jgi:hypothetical protein